MVLPRYSTPSVSIIRQTTKTDDLLLPLVCSSTLGNNNNNNTSNRRLQRRWLLLPLQTGLEANFTTRFLTNGSPLFCLGSATAIAIVVAGEFVDPTLNRSLSLSLSQTLPNPPNACLLLTFVISPNALPYFSPLQMFTIRPISLGLSSLKLGERSHRIELFSAVFATWVRFVYTHILHKLTRSILSKKH